MGLDVGVVRLRYLDRPPGAAYKFAWHLAEMAHWDDECWQVSSGENVFVEFDHDHMISRATEYIESDGLVSSDADQVMRWVRGLPWENGTIMLHLGW